IHELSTDARGFSGRKIARLKPVHQAGRLTVKSILRHFADFFQREGAKVIAIPGKQTNHVAAHAQCVGYVHALESGILLAPKERKRRWANGNFEALPTRNRIQIRRLQLSPHSPNSPSLLTDPPPPSLLHTAPSPLSASAVLPRAAPSRPAKQSEPHSRWPADAIPRVPANPQGLLQR